MPQLASRLLGINCALKFQHSFGFAEANASDVKRILIKMNAKKSVGYDDIPCKFLKIGATPLAGILCQKVDISLEECNFPDLLKFSEIAALFQKIDRLFKGNYRLVSILTAISKVFERMFGKKSCLIFAIRFKKIYLVLDKDIAARPPYYGWLQFGHLNWIIVISL